MCLRGRSFHRWVSPEQQLGGVSYTVYGAEKVYKQLNREGNRVAHYTVERLMGKLGLEGVVGGRAYKVTTQPDGGATRPLDLVECNFEAERPNQLSVSDLTNVATWGGFVDIAFVIDAFARRIVRWRASNSLRSDLRWTLWSRRSASAARPKIAKLCTIATAGPNISVFATPTDWLRPASNSPSAAGAIATTTPSPKA